VSSSHTGRWRGQRAAGVLAVLAFTAALAAPASALAAGIPVAGPFGLTPIPTAGGQPRPYFNLTIAPGRASREIAIISNESSHTERLKITTSKGVTAANSGSAYEGITGRCTGASCWVTGLPRTIILAPGARKGLVFRVAVPHQTRPGQYLAGLTAQSAIRPHAVRVGSKGHASARAIVIDQVTVGIAVTVGSLSRLRTAMAISAVSAGWVGPTPRLFIPIRDTGQTFVRATGTISCRSGGRTHSYRVIMETVLPGGHAVLPINAPGLDTGPVPCTVRLHDGHGRRVTWSGVVSIPAHVATRTYHPAKSVYVSLPENTIPPWAVMLMVIGALILSTLVALLVQSRRRASQPGLARKRARRRPGRTRPAVLARKRTAT
jgi:hypothetical protein